MLSEIPAPHNTVDLIYASFANVMIETSPVNQYTGQPAIDHIKAALQKGMHVVTANKGPVVHAYNELTTLARMNSKRFLFESTVMDGAPIFSLFRHSLPAAHLEGFRGILNSCTNYILGLVAEGKTLAEAIAQAQSIGITETDPSTDLDGWDAAIKVAGLVTVLMGIPLKPQQVDRTGIREITPEMIAEAARNGQRWKLVCTARRQGQQLLEASVKPQLVSPDSPLYSVNGTSSYAEFKLDVLPGLGIVEIDPSPETTAFGLLADLLDLLGNC